MIKEKTIETPEEKNNRELIEKMATNISGLAKQVKALINGPLSRRALIVLLASSSGQSKSIVTDVLKALEDLEKDWLNGK